MDTIMNAKSLDDLCNALNALWAENADNSDFDCEMYGVDLSDLPTFGGPDPDGTTEVFSWDQDRVLISRAGLVPPAWEIVERNRL